MKRSNKIQVLLIISNVIFLLLFGVLSYYNRLSQDDFHFLNNIKQHGIIGSTIYEYQNWGTRWMASLANHTVLTLYQINNKIIFVVGIFNLLFFTAGIYLFLENLNKLFSFIKDPGISWKINISLFVINGIFYSTIKIDETWFWVCASYSYLLSIVMLCWGLAWILHQKKNIPLSIMGCLSFIYVGGSCGPLAILTLLSFVIFLILKRTRLSPVFLKPLKDKEQKVIIACFLSSIAFITLYLGPGNTVRETYFNDISLATALLLNIKTTGMILVLRLPSILLYVVLFSIPAFYLGHINKDKVIIGNWIKKILLITVCFIGTIYLYQLPITYKTQDIGAYRALFTISLISLIYTSSIFYILGNKLELNQGIWIYFLVLPFAISLCINFFNLGNQKVTVTQYAKVYDDRINYLLKNQSFNGAIYLNPLPQSGFLYSAELSSDTSHFSHHHLKKGLGLKCRAIIIESGMKSPLPK